VVVYGRLIPINRVVIDQADIFAPDDFTRITGLTVADFTATLFYNNVAQPWAFQSGDTVTDAQVAAGTVYFNQITGQPGFYSVRFRPNAVGFWRLTLDYAVGLRTLALGFDVVPEMPLVASGLKSSFVPLG
jgi:hypothetical protein